MQKLWTKLDAKKRTEDKMMNCVNDVKHHTNKLQPAEVTQVKDRQLGVVMCHSNIQ